MYTRAFESTEYVFRTLWGLAPDLRNLRSALSQVSRNKGARTAGIDGVTVRMILESDAEEFLQELRTELRSKAFRPSPVRRLLIPKPGKPGKFRPLGIPTVKCRFRHGWMKPPKYASTFMESPVHNERCTPGSEEGAPETT